MLRTSAARTDHELFRMPTGSPDPALLHEETTMPKAPQRRDTKKVGKTLKEKRDAKRTKQQDKKLIER